MNQGWPIMPFQALLFDNALRNAVITTGEAQEVGPRRVISQIDSKLFRRSEPGQFLQTPAIGCKYLRL